MPDYGARIALIPAYKPQALLIDLLRSLHDTGMVCVVVDDGGGAEFQHIFRAASDFATVLTHAENRGKGQAIKTALDYIAENFHPPYVVVTMDADGQHQLCDAVRVCEAAESSPGTLVLGSRRFEGNVPPRSRVGNSITRGVYALTTGVRVHDTQTGLRAFGDRLIDRLREIPGARYEYEMNVLLDFARGRMPISEVWISTIYIDNNAGSHFDTLRDSFRIYKEIFKYSASSFVCFLLDYAIFSLLLFFTGGQLRLANISARAVSACANYFINRKLVFKSESGLFGSALKYFALAAAILAANTVLLDLLTKRVLLHPQFAKILVEASLFAISWLVQRLFIFRKRKG